MEVRGGAGTLARQVAVTAVILLVFLFLRRVPLPGIDPEVLAELRLPRLIPVFLMLGLTPWIVGFLGVELYSLLPGTGRMLRQGGAEGRRRLDSLALAAGVLAALVQASSDASRLESFHSTGFLPLVSSPGRGFRLSCILTLVAASTALFWLAQVITRYGLGNGFSLLFVTQWVTSIVDQLRSSGAGRQRLLDLESGDLFCQLGGTLIAAVLLIVYLRSVEHPHAPAAEVERAPLPEPGEAEGEPAEAEGAEESPAPVAGPRWAVAFPQSFLALGLVTYLLLRLRGGLRLYPGLFLEVPGLAMPWIWIAGEALLVLAAAWLLLRLFSGGNRLATELPLQPGEAARRAADLARRFVPSTLLLVAGSAGLLAWDHLFHTPLWGLWVDFVGLATLVVVVADLASQWRFTAAQGPTARLAALNNVHLAPLLVERLAEAGIPATLQGFRHRALFFAYLAPVRIGVLVPEGRLEEAQAVLAGMEIAVV